MEMVTLLKQGFHLIIVILAMITLPGLLFGLIFSLFQAATQIHEISLTFIPKIIITLVALVVLASVYGPMLTGFTTELFSQIPQLVR